MRGNGWRRLGSYGAQMGMGPAVFLLLAANVALFLLEFLMVGFSGRDYLGAWGSFIPYFAINKLQVWRFVTYMFLHGGLWHLVFNMVGLWLFGSRIETLWGSRTFTWYYFVSGIGGAILYGIFSLAGVEAFNPMIGASGAVYGILLAFGLAFPDAVLLVFFVIPMKARYAVILFAAMALFGFGGANVAHMAHLGGMVTGVVFLWIFTGGRLSQVPRLPHSGGARGAYRSGGYPGQDRARSYGGSGYQPTTMEKLRQSFVRWRTRLRLKVVSSQKGGQGAARPGNGRSNDRRKISEVDAILEKISKEGLKSLTPEEQDILRRASRKD